MRLHRIFWLGLALTLSACVNLDLGGGKDAKTIVYYVLEDGGRTSAPAASPAPRSLILADTMAGAFYDTDGMVFSREAGTRGHYQFARWSERTGKRFSDMLLARLERERAFGAVAQSGTNVRGDWILTSDIIEFYHDAISRPGNVRMELRAEVVDLKTRKLLSRKTFVQSVAVQSFDAAGAHKAFNRAATLMLDDIADWLKELASTP